MVHIKEPLLLIEKNSPCSGGIRFPISEWFYTICPMPDNRKCVECVIKEKKNLSFQTCALNVISVGITRVLERP